MKRKILLPVILFVSISLSGGCAANQKLKQENEALKREIRNQTAAIEALKKELKRAKLREKRRSSYLPLPPTSSMPGLAPVGVGYLYDWPFYRDPRLIQIKNNFPQYLWQVRINRRAVTIWEGSFQQQFIPPGAVLWVIAPHLGWNTIELIGFLPDHLGRPVVYNRHQVWISVEGGAEVRINPQLTFEILKN